MFPKLLVRSALLILSSVCMAQAYIVPGEPAPLPTYHDGQPYYPGQNPGDNSGPGASNPYSPNPYEPGAPGNNGGETKTIYIGRSVNNESLPLRELAGLDGSYDGSEVISVTANTRPNSPYRTVVSLVADGRVIAQQVNPGYQIHLRPNGQAILGANVRSLELVISGSTEIGQIQIQVGGGGGGGYQPPYPGPGPGPITPPPPPYNPPGYGQQQRVEVPIHRSLFGNDRLDLNQYINLDQYRGYAITQILISAAAQYQTAFIDVLINSFSQGQIQVTGGYPQEQAVWLQNRPVIGQGADSIVLYTRGNLSVDHVTLILSN